MSNREAYIAQCIRIHGLPYGWGFKGFPSEPYAGRDCSGFATERLHSVLDVDWRADHNADSLYRFLPATDNPQPGDLAFWGDGTTAHHVMVHLGVGDLLIGAAGGDHTTLSLADALDRHAQVMVWSGPNYMSGFMGYRTLSPLDVLTPAAVS